MNPTSDRRDFLKMLSAGGAGFLMGVCSEQAAQAAQAASTAGGVFVPDALLRIDRTGDVIVTIIKSDMGQNIRSGLAMIAAAITCALTSSASNATRMALQMAVGAVFATVTGYLFTCYVYPNIDGFPLLCATLDRKSTRLNSSHT